MGGRADYEKRRQRRIERYKIVSQKKKEESDARANSNAEIRRDLNTQGKEYIHELAHQVENVEEQQKESGQEDSQITEADYIPNTDKTWGELMEETGESLPNLVERYNNEMTKSNGKEQPQSIIQRIIEDYQMVSHEHNRGH